jgi:hypothetical protein
MNAWPDEELRHVGDATELRVASQRADGTLRPYVTIWHARLGDAIYIRSAQGPQNGWFRRAKSAGTGRISSGGIERDVTFEPAPADVQTGLNAAYHAKYDRYGPARSATSPAPTCWGRHCASCRATEARNHCTRTATTTEWLLLLVVVLLQLVLPGGRMPNGAISDRQPPPCPQGSAHG